MVKSEDKGGKQYGDSDYRRNRVPWSAPEATSVASGRKRSGGARCRPQHEAMTEVAQQVKVVQGDVMEVTSLIDTIKKYNIEGIIHLAYFLGTGGMRNPLPSI